jgi:hypothetical protein
VEIEEEIINGQGSWGLKEDQNVFTRVGVKN